MKGKHVHGGHDQHGPTDLEKNTVVILKNLSHGKFICHKLMDMTRGIGWDGEDKPSGSPLASFGSAADAAEFAEAQGWTVDYKLGVFSEFTEEKDIRVAVFEKGGMYEVFTLRETFVLGWDGQPRGPGEQNARFAEPHNAASFAEAHGWDVDYKVGAFAQPDEQAPPIAARLQNLLERVIKPKLVVYVSQEHAVVVAIKKEKKAIKRLKKQGLDVGASGFTRIPFEDTVVVSLEDTVSDQS